MSLIINYIILIVIFKCILRNIQNASLMLAVKLFRFLFPPSGVLLQFYPDLLEAQQITGILYLLSCLQAIHLFLQIPWISC